MGLSKESLLAKMSLASGKLLDETFGEATDAECWTAERKAAADWLMADEHTENLQTANRILRELVIAWDSTLQYDDFGSAAAHVVSQAIEYLDGLEP